MLEIEGVVGVSLMSTKASVSPKPYLAINGFRPLDDLPSSVLILILILIVSVFRLHPEVAKLGG